MFILDSLMISGIQWVLKSALTAAETEMNDDTALREQLLEAEMRRETGEIADNEFEEIETDLLARIREIRERREGAGPLALGGAQPIETSSDTTFRIETEVSGDFHEPRDRPQTTVVAVTPASVEEVVTPARLRNSRKRPTRATAATPVGAASSGRGATRPRRRLPKPSTARPGRHGKS